jgi:hypothetical protein
VSYKVEQCHVRSGGRVFHFVSYDGEPANERRGVPEMPPMWYLMGPGKRWPVMPQVAGQDAEAIESALLRWVIAEGLNREAAPPPVRRASARRATHP